MIQRKYLLLISIAGFILILDQMSKLYIHTNFFLGESIEIIKGFFNFTYVRNTGAAFGVFSDTHKFLRILFFFAMPFLALLIVIFMVRNLKESENLYIFALSCIFGGALGNLMDRLRFGYVIDFLDFYIGKHAWPAFNIADISIVSGIILLFFITFKKPKQTE